MSRTPARNFLVECKSQFIEMFGTSDMVEKTVGELASVITKGTTPTTIGFEFVDTGVNFVKVEDITDDNKILKNKLMHISLGCHEKLLRSQLKEKDILISIAGAIGKVALVSSDILPANTNQALALIRLKSEDMILIDFLMASLRSQYVINQYLNQMRGSTQQNLSLKNISNLVIQVPPLDLQREYVDFVKQSDKSKFEVLKSYSNLNLSRCLAP